MTTRAEHWNHVYESKAPQAVSWYRPQLDRSLALIDSLNLSRDARIIDVGCGASSLIADLFRRGYRNLIGLDIADRAIDIARSALGDAAESVRWMVADITEAQLPAASLDLWHDRAAFHFLTVPADRARYAALARRSIVPGGHILVGGFAPDGPARCSDLDVVRASPEAVHAALGDGFQCVATASEAHTTPWGSSQSFAYCLCQRTS